MVCRPPGGKEGDSLWVESPRGELCPVPRGELCPGLKPWAAVRRPLKRGAEGRRGRDVLFEKWKREERAFPRPGLLPEREGWFAGPRGGKKEIHYGLNHPEMNYVQMPRGELCPVPRGELCPGLKPWAAVRRPLKRGAEGRRGRDVLFEKWKREERAFPRPGLLPEGKGWLAGLRGGKGRRPEKIRFGGEGGYQRRRSR